MLPLASSVWCTHSHPCNRYEASRSTGGLSHEYESKTLNVPMVVPSGSVIKSLPSMQEMWQEPRVQSLGWKDPLEKGMATHSSILAWRILWTEEPGGLESIGSQNAGHDWSDLTHTHILYWFIFEQYKSSILYVFLRSTSKVHSHCSVAHLFS